MKVKFVFFVLVIVILISGGYWFSLEKKTNSQPVPVLPSPFLVSSPSGGFRQFLKRRFPFPGSFYTPPDTEVVEGVIAESEIGKLVLTSDGQNFTFFLDDESLFYFPEGGKGATVGVGFKVYYKERDGKLYIVYGIELK